MASEPTSQATAERVAAAAQEPGTVFFALVAPEGQSTEKGVFDGSPQDVVHAATGRALDLLLHSLE